MMAGYNARYTALCTAWAGTVGVLAALLGADGRAIAVGASFGLLLQLGLFFLLFVWLFPAQRALAYGTSMVARFGAVAAAALLVVPVARVPAAATLFCLVAVLFGTTLVEAVLFRISTPAAPPVGAVTLATER